MESLTQLFTTLINNPDFLTYILLPGLSLITYFLYLHKFKYYINRHTYNESDPKMSRRRGSPPPSFPNGWFRALSSWELKLGDTKYMKANGRHVVLFRGEDNEVYCLSAFCGHMGANLGEGGQVKWNSCIECPFHGWAYNGKDGKCVNSSAMDLKKVEHYTYEEDYSNKNGGFLKKDPCKKDHSTSQIDKFEVCERNGIIFVWFHAENKPPLYQLGHLKDFRFCKGITGSAETWDYVNAHIQEIPENGGDFKHLNVVHVVIHPLIHPYIKYKWVPKSAKLDQKDFDEVMRHHKKKEIQRLQNELYDDFKTLNAESQQHVNVLAIDSYISFFDKYDIPLATATVFQIGSGTVYLFMKIQVIGRILIVQSVTPIQKFTQQVCHKLFSSWWLPSWISAGFINSYNGVVNQDLRIWNNKVFSRQAQYGKDNFADLQLRKWRENYAQYYEGCGKWEKEQENMAW